MNTLLLRALARRLTALEERLYLQVNTRLVRWSTRLSGEAMPPPVWPELEALLDQLWTPETVSGLAPRASELRALIAARWPAPVEIKVRPEEALLWAVCLVGREARDAWREGHEHELPELVRWLACLETLELCRMVAGRLSRALQSPEQIDALHHFLERLKDGGEGEP